MSIINAINKKQFEYEKEEFFLNVYRWEFLRRNKNYMADIEKYQKEIKKIYSTGRNNFKRIRPKLEKVADYFTKSYGMETPEDFNYTALELLAELNNIKKAPAVTYQNIKKAFSKYRGSKLKVRYPGWLPRGVKCLTPLEHEVIDKRGESTYLQLTDEEIEKQNFIQVKIDLDVKRERLLIALEELISLWQDMRSKVTNKKGSRIMFQNYDEYLKIWDLHEQKKTIREIAKEVYPRRYDNSASNSNDDNPRHANEALFNKVRKQLATAAEIIEGQFSKIK